jgi:hypothetical protein
MDEIADRALADQLARLVPRRKAAHLEIEEVQHACSLGGIAHFARLAGVDAERLVAQHGLALGERGHDVGLVLERRRVDRDQVRIARAGRLDRTHLARRDDLYLPAASLECRLHRARAKAPADNRNLHRASPLKSRRITPRSTLPEPVRGRASCRKLTTRGTL